MSLKKLPPHCDDAEKSVLGAILLNNDALNKVADLLNVDDFYQPTHQKIYARMIEMFDQNEEIDLLTLSESLNNNGDLEMIGGAPVLMDLMEATPTSTTIIHHAKIVQEKSTLRKLIAISTQINLESYGEKVKSKKLITRAEELLMEIGNEEKKTEFQSLTDLMPHCFEMVESIYEKKGSLTGLSTGFSDIDELTSGLQKTDLIIIAARPSMGKTSFGLNIACNLAIKENIPVAIFSLETSKQQLILRMLCAEARVSSHSLKRGFLRDKDWPRLTRAAGALSSSPIYIDDTAGISPTKIRSKLKQLKKINKDLGLVIVDYLQLMTSRKKKENRQQEITYISSSLKEIGRELNVPIIALCQLNRAVENRRPPRPILSDLRESGSLEQDADLVAFIYRPDYRKENQNNSSLTKIIIAKHRNGPTGEVELVFMKPFTRFEEKTPDWVNEQSLPAYNRDRWGK
ncbi:replicative DNA helicase [Candidatus Pacearchaeota archaeon]|nr:replicative DNA helicase [Candidatus Pacearchaeota archaeon]